PPLRADQDQLHLGIVERAERFDHAMQVLPRLDRPDEQDVRALESVPPADLVAELGPWRSQAYAPRNHPQPLGSDAGILTRRLGGDGWAHHEARVPTRELQSPAEHLARVPCVVVGVREE